MNKAGFPVNISEGTAGATISIEKILALDPEVMLVQGNYLPGERQVTVEGVLRDPRLGSLRAVRSGRVGYTFGFWALVGSGVVLFLLAPFIQRLMHGVK